MGKRVLYQLKSCGRDKLCILSFLLPVIAGLMLNFLTDIDLTQLAEPEFAVLEGEFGSGEEKNWLEQMGTVKEYASEEALKKAVLEPAGNVLGIREQAASCRRCLPPRSVYILFRCPGYRLFSFSYCYPVSWLRWQVRLLGRQPAA